MNFWRNIIEAQPDPQQPGNNLLKLDCGHTVSRYGWGRKLESSLCKPCEDHWRWEQLR